MSDLGYRLLACAVIVMIAAWFVEDADAHDHLTETRYCGEVQRDKQGRIKRNSYLVRKFEQLYPLPEGYDRSDWAVDHVIPLANGGCDAIRNMQWLPNSIKRGSDDDNKDRWERKVYPPQESLQ